MHIEPTALSGVMCVTPPIFKDERGGFSETWNLRSFAECGIKINFVQDNHSFSHSVHTLRGFHFQRPPHAQDKLVRCIAGSILDVAVDIRVGSPTYLKCISVELSERNAKQLLVPKGFLHGFLTLEPNTQVVYKCSDYYDPKCDAAISYNDPDIECDWGLGEKVPTLSVKDKNAPLLRDVTSPFLYEG